MYTRVTAYALGLGVLWAVALIWLVWRLPMSTAAEFAWTLIYPVYYVGMSLVLHARRRVVRA